ncbi:MAG: hypothetical protein WC464_02275 [Bdellovibrionales bacterium]
MKISINKEDIRNKNYSAAQTSRQSGGSRSSEAAAAEGSTSSNTDPSGTNTEILRHGVDSLYVSCKGALSIDCIDLLEEKKRAAQSDDIAVSSTAQVEVAGHLFEVKDKGGGGFAFVVKDNAFKIYLNKSIRNKKPMTYTQISSEYLTLRGPAEAIQDLEGIIAVLGTKYEPLSISRADLCVDFTTGFDFENLCSGDFVTKCEEFASFERKPFLTGMSAGMGGDIAFRLYDKTEELMKNARPYLKALWHQKGWDGKTKVWRTEFEVKREAIKGLEINTVDDLIRLDASLWSFLTNDWLRIVAQNPNDTHRERWPSQPFWIAVSRAFGTENVFPLAQRFKNQRVPDVEMVIRRVGSALASFMAIEGVENISRAFSLLCSQADSYFARISRLEEDFSSHVQKKIAEKCKKYNLQQLSDRAPVNTGGDYD